ncbi:OTU domain-containing protein [Corallococcus exercitus]|uniref:OTU domain-containing protein n=1 Tax=Corallococcus exercitus TaxID=2316736 RepID=UPI0035D3D9EB
MLFECPNRKCEQQPFEVTGALAPFCPKCGATCSAVKERKRKLEADISPPKSGAPLPSKGLNTATPPRVIKRQRLVGVLPRCEYRARLKGTTVFKMEHAQYWDTYARSGKSRENEAYDAPGISTAKKEMDHYAKTGTYKNVFAFSKNHQRLLEDKGASSKPLSPAQRLPDSFVHQRSLDYRKAACAYIIQQLKLKGSTVTINADNDYPCLLVLSPEGPTEAEFPGNKNAKKLEASLSQWTRLVMAFVVGITNHLAWRKGLPIELVMRSSFGHLGPSIADCIWSYRINVGIIPRAYMDVLVEAILKTEDIFHDLKRDLATMEVDESFGELTDDYFLNILFRRYKKHYPGISKADLQEKYEAKGGVKAIAADLKKHNQTMPRRLNDAENLWDWLWGAGDGSGKTVLTQIVSRMMQNLESIGDNVWQALEADEDLTGVLAALPSRFKLNSTRDDAGITMETLELGELLVFEKIPNAGKETPLNDEPFWNTIQLIMTCLGGLHEAQEVKKTRRVGGLYGMLEQLHVDFIHREGSAQMPFSTDGYGSDSDEETDDVAPSGRIYSKKVIVATGMRSIHLAHHCGRLWAANEQLDVTNIVVYANQMYYETEPALGSVPIKLDVGKFKKQQSLQMLFFDLNHCNNIQARDTDPDVQFEDYDIVVLDHTSSTAGRVNTYLQRAFAPPRVQLVLLVTSGLKNEQGGGDMNHYGTLRIITRDKALREHLYAKVLEAEGDYMHPRQSHAIRKAYKRSGFVPTTRNFFKPGFSVPLPTSGVVPLPSFAHQGITFEVRDVEADGDCLFAALALALGLGHDAANVRQRIHQRLSTTQKALVPNGMYLQIGLGFSTREVHNPDEYLATIQQQYVWGGLTEIRAFSHEKPVVVFETPTEARLFHNGVEAQGFDWNNLPPGVVYIAFYGNHFAALRRTN